MEQKTGIKGAQERNLPIESREVTHDGKTVIQVETLVPEREVRYVLLVDPNRGYLVLQMERFRRGSLDSRWEIGDIKEYAPGIWFPSTYEEVKWGELANGERAKRMEAHVRVSEFHVNVDVDPREFTADGLREGIEGQTIAVRDERSQVPANDG